MRAILLGLLASLFFAITFVLNRAMQLSGGSFLWSASLRYFLMVPPLVIIVLIRGNIRPLLQHMKVHIWKWFLWSTIGFGLFYAPICFAAAYGPSWLIASTWQITIIAGSLLVPLFYSDEGVRYKIPLRGLMISLVILIGVIIMQIGQDSPLSSKDMIIGIVPIVIAAFAYPLGNRKMMALCKGQMDTYQRVLGMTLASMPFWILLAIIGLTTVGAPGFSQVTQSLVIAMSSGVIATLLFFKATDLTKGDIHRLAAVEATQSGEIIFALFGELIILNGIIPSSLAAVGMLLVICGMVMHSLLSK